MEQGEASTTAGMGSGDWAAMDTEGASSNQDTGKRAWQLARAERNSSWGASRNQAPAIGRIRRTADDPGGGLQDQEQHPQQKGADLADHYQEDAHADEEKEDRGELDRNQAGKAIERGTPACCRKGRTPPSMEEAGARASSTSQPGRTSRAAGCRRSEGRKTPGKEDVQELGAVGAAR